MHTVWARANAVIFYALTVLLVLACMSAVSVQTRARDPELRLLRLNTLNSFRNQYSTDRALLSLDVDADMTPVWSWNTKQLFVTVVAEYKTTSNRLNHVVLLDHVIQEKEHAHIDVRDVFVKYALQDIRDELRDTHIRLKLMWDENPITGLLAARKVDGEGFELPTVYI